MQPIRSLLLAGFATLAIAGLTGFAHAGEPSLKTLTVQLPDGGIEQVQYSGAVAPQIVLVPLMAAGPVGVPPQVVGAPDPFAVLEHMSAIMDQQAAAMMNAMNAMAAGAVPPPGVPMPAALVGSLPSGSSGYSMISAMSGGMNGACMQSVEITAMGNGQPPRVVTHSMGHCGALPAPGMSGPSGQPAAAVPAAMPPAPAPADQPKLIRVRDVLPQTVPRASQT